MVVTHGSLQRARGRCALTIGNFDGVHRGHRALIDRVVAKARERELASCVLTFEPHPREFFAAAKPRRRASRGCATSSSCSPRPASSASHVARFDARFAALAPRALHRRRAGARAGRALAAGRARFPLRRAARRRLRDAASGGAAPRLRASKRCATSTFEGERVSSSAVRAALAAGDLARRRARCSAVPTPSAAASRTATKLGRDLGFPTANIVLRRSRRRSPASSPCEVHGFGRGAAPAWRASACVRRSTRWRCRCSRCTCSTATSDLYGRASARRVPAQAARRGEVRRPARALQRARSRAMREQARGVLSETHG